MTDRGVGRMLAASLHQGIVDLHPARLEFYEGWLSPSELRAGRIGLASLVAVLSFLRQEGEWYGRIAGRAGEYAADWTVSGLTRFHRALIRAMPRRLQARLILRLTPALVGATSSQNRAVVRWRRGRGLVDIQGSVFCDVRERTAHPLCDYYVSAIQRLFAQFGLDAQVGVDQCRATGAGHCVMSVQLGPAEG